jgi:hypothetical protein
VLDSEGTGHKTSLALSIPKRYYKERNMGLPESHFKAFFDLDLPNSHKVPLLATPASYASISRYDWGCA